MPIEGSGIEVGNILGSVFLQQEAGPEEGSATSSLAVDRAEACRGVVGSATAGMTAVSGQPTRRRSSPLSNDKSKSNLALRHTRRVCDDDVTTTTSSLRNRLLTSTSVSSDSTSDSDCSDDDDNREEERKGCWFCNGGSDEGRRRRWTNRRPYLSAALFLAGSILYLIMDSWDLHSSLGDDDDVDDDDDGNESPSRSAAYRWIYVGAATCFLLDGVYEFVSAWRQKKNTEMRTRRSRRILLHHESSSSSSEEGLSYGLLVPLQQNQTSPVSNTIELTPSTDGGCGGGGSSCLLDATTDDHHCSEEHITTAGRSTTNCCSSSGGGVASYETKEANVGMSVGICLFLGGCFDIVAASYLTANESRSNTFNAVAVHWYLLEAIVAVFGKKLYLKDDTILLSREGIGDSLFLIGSLIDVTLGYCYLNPALEEGYNLDIGGVISSVLWLLNAVIVYPWCFLSWQG